MSNVSNPHFQSTRQHLEFLDAIYEHPDQRLAREEAARKIAAEHAQFEAWVKQNPNNFRQWAKSILNRTVSPFQLWLEQSQYPYQFQSKSKSQS